MEFSSDNYDYDFNHTKTHSEESEKSLAPFQHFAAGYLTLIFCISMPGNCFLLWVLRAERAWRTTPDILLLQLTVSNLCMTATLPLTACNDLHSWIFGEWACGLWRWVSALAVKTHAAIISAMALHRYVTVVHASWLPTRLPSKVRVIVASVVMWLVCAAASFSLVRMELFTYEDMKFCGYVIFSMTSLVVETYAEIFLLFLIPFIIITVCYVHMWLLIRQGRVDGHHQLPKLIMGISVGYLICLAPHTIIMFNMSLVYLDVMDHTHMMLHESIVVIMYVVFHFYSCLNPLFHIFGAERFKRYLPLPCYKLLQRGGRSNISSVPHITLHNAPE